MDKRRGTWLAHGASGHFQSRVRKPDDILLRSMVLNLMTVVGFVFLILILLHLFYGLESLEALYVYAALFLTIEGAVVAARLYFYCHKRAHDAPLINDVENTVQAEEKVTKSKWEGISSSYSEQGSKTFHPKKNSF